MGTDRRSGFIAAEQFIVSVQKNATAVNLFRAQADYPRQAYRPATQADYHAQMFHSTPTAVYPRQPDANVTMQPGTYTCSHTVKET